MKAFLSFVAVLYFVHQASAVQYLLMRAGSSGYISASGAKDVCTSFSDSLATIHDVQAANNDGLQYCECAWANNGAIQEAFYMAKSECGYVRGGLNGSPTHNGVFKCDPKLNYRGAWCNSGTGSGFTIPYPIHMEEESQPYQLTFGEARVKCQAWGHRLATRAEVDYAFNLGFGRCACGWIADGSSVYPQQYAYPGCGNRGVNTCTWRDQWNAWCAVSD